MLNSKALTELLSRNSDQRLCKRWLIMTPNGTLLAYTIPTDIRDLRRQAAVAALAWQEHSMTRGESPSSPEDDEPRSPSIAIAGLLRTLTIENDNSTLIVRKIQPSLLLVLEGGVPPRKRAAEQKMTPERPDDAPYPALQDRSLESAPGSSASSVAESTKTKASSSRKTLALQRGRLDSLASAIASDLEKTGFRMPDDDTTKLF